MNIKYRTEDLKMFHGRKIVDELEKSDGFTYMRMFYSQFTTLFTLLNTSNTEVMFLNVI